MKDYRVTVKVRNNRIISAIEAAGGSLGPKWCEANSLPYSSVNDLINMTESPILKDGSLSLAALRLCEVLDKIPDDLWNANQLYPLEKNFSEIEMDHEQIHQLIENNYENMQDYCVLDTKYLLDAIDGEMESNGLLGRERRVLQVRYIEGGTLEAAGLAVGVTRERARQIEASGLRKLRRSSLLREIYFAI